MLLRWRGATAPRPGVPAGHSQSLSFRLALTYWLTLELPPPPSPLPPPPRRVPARSLHRLCAGAGGRPLLGGPQGGRHAVWVRTGRPRAASAVALVGPAACPWRSALLPPSPQQLLLPLLTFHDTVSVLLSCRVAAIWACNLGMLLAARLGHGFPFAAISPHLAFLDAHRRALARTHPCPPPA